MDSCHASPWTCFSLIVWGFFCYTFWKPQLLGEMIQFWVAYSFSTWLRNTKTTRKIWTNLPQLQRLTYFWYFVQHFFSAFFFRPFFCGLYFAEKKANKKAMAFRHPIELSRFSETQLAKQRVLLGLVSLFSCFISYFREFINGVLYCKYNPCKMTEHEWVTGALTLLILGFVYLFF